MKNVRIWMRIALAAAASVAVITSIFFGVIQPRADALSYRQILGAMVDDGTPDSGGDDERIPSAFPEAETEEGVLSYLEERYPPTRDQSPGEERYGSCWAHAAVALAEFYMISHGLRDAAGPVDRTVDYSELQLAYFCYHQGPEEGSGSFGDHVFWETDTVKKSNFLSIGGVLGYAAQNLIQGSGLVREAEAGSYREAAKAVENGVDEGLDENTAGVRLKNQFVLDIRSNPNLVKQAIMANGAVGIRYYSAPEYLNEETAAYYNDQDDVINHVVVLVGWDDNYPASLFKKRPPGNGAWLVRNSHSVKTAFSGDSYFWLSYHDTSIGRETYVFEMADMDKGECYDNIYSYDTQTHQTRFASSSKAANVFRIEGTSESLQAVQFDASKFTPGRYTVSIYKNPVKANDPESGTLAARLTGAIFLLGRYTLPLREPVILTGGETLAVVVETEGRIDRERGTLWRNQITFDVNIGGRESFSYENGEWIDLAEHTLNGTFGNLCIRICTNDVKGSLPEKVSRLTITDEENDRVVLEWSEAAGAEGYEILRRETGDEYFLGIGTTQAGTAAFADETVRMGREYEYKVVPLRSGFRGQENVSPAVKPEVITPVPFKLVLDRRACALKVGEKVKIRAKIYPEDARFSNVQWLSGKSTVAQVDSDGMVEALAPGTATIFAGALGGKAVCCFVTVEAPAAEKIVLWTEGGDSEMAVGSEAELDVRTTPEKALVPKLKWESSDPKIAVVTQKGKVRAKGSGTVRITASSEGGLLASCDITVSPLDIYECRRGKAVRYVSGLNAVKALESKGWKCAAVFGGCASSNNPIFWIYDKEAKGYFYTADKKEAMAAREAGDNSAVAFYASDLRDIPVYALRSPKKKTVHYVADRKKARRLVKKGWSYEGIAFYAEPE